MNCGFWMPTDWTEWAALVQIMQFGLVVAALIYAKNQLDESSRSRKLEATRQMLVELGSDEIRALRTWLLHEASAEDLGAPFGTEAFEKARRIAVAL